MYNPYEEEMMRRRLQPRPDQPQFQQPAPMTNLPLYPGPEQAQWLPMGDSGQQDMNAAGGDMASLLKRFKRPGSETPHIGSISHAGTGGGVGPVGHGY